MDTWLASWKQDAWWETSTQVNIQQQKAGAKETQNRSKNLISVKLFQNKNTIVSNEHALSGKTCNNH